MEDEKVLNEDPKPAVVRPVIAKNKLIWVDPDEFNALLDAVEATLDEHGSNNCPLNLQEAYEAFRPDAPK